MPEFDYFRPAPPPQLEGAYGRAFQGEKDKAEAYDWDLALQEAVGAYVKRKQDVDDFNAAANLKRELAAGENERSLNWLKGQRAMHDETIGLKREEVERERLAREAGAGLFSRYRPPEEPQDPYGSPFAGYGQQAPPQSPVQDPQAEIFELMKSLDPAQQAAYVNMQGGMAERERKITEASEKLAAKQETDRVKQEHKAAFDDLELQLKTITAQAEQERKNAELENKLESPRDKAIARWDKMGLKPDTGDPLTQRPPESPEAFQRRAEAWIDAEETRETARRLKESPGSIRPTPPTDPMEPFRPALGGAAQAEPAQAVVPPAAPQQQSVLGRAASAATFGLTDQLRAWFSGEADKPQGVTPQQEAIKRAKDLRKAGDNAGARKALIDAGFTTPEQIKAALSGG